MLERVNSSRKNRLEIQRKKRRKKWIYGILGFLLTAILAYAIYFVVVVWGAFSKGHDEHQKSQYRQSEIDINKDPFTIMLLGTDQYDAEAEEKEYRTDVIMVAAINPKQKSMKILSIPRDTRTEIANTNGFKTKINAAAYWGRQKGVNPIENVRLTVEKFLGGVPIDYYVKINFRGLIDLVDAVGGVDVYVPFSFKTSTFGGKVMRYKTGPMHLNGEQALPYVRMRKKDPLGDHGRNKRQQQVVSALMDKLVSINSLAKVGDITKAIGDNLQYSIHPTEFLTLISIYKNIPKKNIEIVKMEVGSEKIDGIYYDIVTEKERKRISKLFKTFLELPVSDDEKQTSNEETHTEFE